MKIIVTGSLGHISKPLTKELVEKGHSVTVVSSRQEMKGEIEALGASAAIGKVEDGGFLSRVFEVADAVYTMIPPTNYFNPQLDLAGYVSGISENYVIALRQSGVKRVVHLSSIGAHLTKGSGIIRPYYDMEAAVNGLSADVAITLLRPTAFYYNLLGFVNVIKNTGGIASNYGGEDWVSWVSPTDIAAVVAEELLAEKPVSRKVRYVASEELTCNEVASILGKAIGKPDLQWNRVSTEQMQSGLEAVGMPAGIAAGYLEMNYAMHTGLLFEDYRRNPPVLGKVKLVDFAKEFAAAYGPNQ